MKIERKLVQVGNSKAVIIPSEWLESKPNLETLILDLQENQIVITLPENKIGGTDGSIRTGSNQKPAESTPAS